MICIELSTYPISQIYVASLYVSRFRSGEQIEVESPHHMGLQAFMRARESKNAWTLRGGDAGCSFHTAVFA